MTTNVLDTDAVAAWLSDHLAGFQGPITAEKFPGGQSNPTSCSTPRRTSMSCAASRREPF